MGPINNVCPTVAWEIITPARGETDIAPPAGEVEPKGENTPPGDLRHLARRAIRTLPKTATRTRPGRRPSVGRTPSVCALPNSQHHAAALRLLLSDAAGEGRPRRRENRAAATARNVIAGGRKTDGASMSAVR